MSHSIQYGWHKYYVIFKYKIFSFIVYIWIVWDTKRKAFSLELTHIRGANKNKTFYLLFVVPNECVILIWNSVGRWCKPGRAFPFKTQTCSCFWYFRIKMHFSFIVIYECYVAAAAAAAPRPHTFELIMCYSVSAQRAKCNIFSVWVLCPAY